MFKHMKNITHKLHSLNEVQWALILIGAFIVTLVVLTLLGVYKVDVLR